MLRERSALEFSSSTGTKTPMGLMCSFMLIIIPQQQDIPECVYLGNEQFSMYVHVCVWSVGVGNREAACVVVAVSTWVSSKFFDGHQLSLRYQFDCHLFWQGQSNDDTAMTDTSSVPHRSYVPVPKSKIRWHCDTSHDLCSYVDMHPYQPLY